MIENKEKSTVKPKTSAKRPKAEPKSQVAPKKCCDNPDLYSGRGDVNICGFNDKGDSKDITRRIYITWCGNCYAEVK